MNNMYRKDNHGDGDFIVCMDKILNADEVVDRLNEYDQKIRMQNITFNMVHNQSLEKSEEIDSFKEENKRLKRLLDESYRSRIDAIFLCDRCKAELDTDDY